MSDVPDIKERNMDCNSISQRREAITGAFKTILESVEGPENCKRQGLLKTPTRAADAVLFFTKGYEENLQG